MSVERGARRGEARSGSPDGLGTAYRVLNALNASLPTDRYESNGRAGAAALRLRTTDVTAVNALHARTEHVGAGTRASLQGTRAMTH